MRELLASALETSCFLHSNFVFMIDGKVFKLIESNFREIVMKRILKSIFGGAVVLFAISIRTTTDAAEKDIAGYWPLKEVNIGKKSPKI